MGQSQGRPILFTDEVQLDHFKLLRVVGKGAFGKVRIVERRDTGLTFALKYIRKDEVVRSESVRNIVRERRMLEHLNHPFLCNLRYSFQDYDYLYLVVDLMSGGDLRFHISRKAFKEEAVRFWIAELGCALRYIHKQGVVHRDVKPDNVLLDSQGHVHLADFNVASEFSASKALTSKSGTLAYLAPEVHEGKGYRSEVDWWSLGVLFYECIYNRRPFEGANHEELAAKIKQAMPRFPITQPLVSTPCCSAMNSLMSKRLDDRIGANGFSNFSTHPFFMLNGTIDFEALEKRQLQPVFRPSSEKTNFDATYDLEELLLEEAPLEARAKHHRPRAQPRADASPREKRAAQLYQMIEQLFEPFDYTSASYEKFSGGPDESPVSGPDSALIVDTGAPMALSNSGQGEQPFRTNTPGPAAELPLSHGADSPPHTGSPPLTTQHSLPALIGGQASPSDEVPPMPLGPPPTSEPKADKPQFKRSQSMGGRGFSSFGEEAGPKRTAVSNDSQSSQKRRTKEGGKKGGFLGFLSSKKDKERTLRDSENGVLGKEGARVIIKEG